MCTISWLAAGGLHVHFNRDERRTRDAALPPQLWAASRKPFLAPLDPEGGGTWIAAASTGTIHAVLNDYGGNPRRSHSPPSGIRKTSRGLVPVCLADGSWHTRDLLRDPSLVAGCPPFHLITLSENLASRLHWDGATWHHHPLDAALGCFSTSSWQPDEVPASRTAAFDRLFDSAPRRDPGLLSHFHNGMETGGVSAASVLMEREDSRTVSQTRVTITNGKLSMTYRARDPHGQSFLPWCDPVETETRAEV